MVPRSIPISSATKGGPGVGGINECTITPTAITVINTNRIFWDFLFQSILQWESSGKNSIEKNGNGQSKTSG